MGTPLDPLEPSTRFDAFISYSHAADDLLAPRLQSGLQQFAKPWWRRRALRVFRDQASLSANPHLWSSITEALAGSEWFVILTSPEAAASPWVNREVAWWLEHKDPERILPVLTDGVLEWDEAANGWAAASAVPASLQRAFQEEPRWVDLTWAKDDTDLDLGNPRFREAVADIASAVHGIPKDELHSEEVRQHRRTKRTVWAAGVALGLFAAGSAVAAVYAFDQRNEAEAQQIEAEAQRSEAETQRAAALSAGALARSRELAASAINTLDVNPELSVLLALESIEIAPPESDPPIETVSALREAVHASKLRHRGVVTELGGPVFVSLSPDGTRLGVVSGLEGLVQIRETGTWDVIWEYREPETVDYFWAPYFSPDGSRIAVGIVDSSSLNATPRSGSETDDGLPARLVILDALTGDVLETRSLGSCPSSTVQPYSPDGRWLAVTMGEGPECDDEHSASGGMGWRIDLLDAETLEVAQSFPAPYFSEVSWSADSTRMSFTTSDGSGTIVHDLTTSSSILEIPAIFTGTLSPDGSLLASMDFEGGFSLNLHNVDTGLRVDNLAGLPDFPSSFEFTADGSRLIAGSQGNAAAMWDLGTGEIVHILPGTGGTWSIAFDDATGMLYHGGEGEFSVWDLSGASEGEFDSVATNHWVQGNAIAATGSRGAFLAFDLPNGGLPVIWPFDAATGVLGSERRSTNQAAAPAILPDGRIVLGDQRGVPGDPGEEWGPVIVWDPDSGSVENLLGCWALFSTIVESNYGETPVSCTEGDQGWFPFDRAFVSPEGSRLLVTSALGELHVFDSSTLELLSTVMLPEAAGGVMGYGGDWILASDVATGISGPVSGISVISADSGAIITTMPGDEVAVSRDGLLAALVDGPGQVSVYDTSSWDLVSSIGAGQSRIRGLEFSPGASLVMTGATDGFVRVWDSQTGAEVARIPLDGASDAHWLDEQHLAVGTSAGLWTTLTLDVDELRALAVSRLTRGLTQDECDVYLLDPCPEPVAILEGD